MRSSFEVHIIKLLQCLKGPAFMLLIFSSFTLASTEYTDLFDHSYNKVLPGNDDELIGLITPEECAQKCLQGTATVPEGECLSFDYRKVSGGRCQLSKSNKDTVGQALDSNYRFDHYEMKDILSFFTVYPDHALPGHDHADVRPTTVSPRTCALRCLLGVSHLSVGSCLSLDLDQGLGRCLLSRDNQDTAGQALADNRRFDHYRRNGLCIPNPCVHAHESCTNQGNGYNCTCDAGWGGDNCDTFPGIIDPQNCADLLAMGFQTSGTYHVGHPQPFQVSCDMDTDGGGWTVIQRRQDGSVSFGNTWDVYVQGFGNVSGELWLGLDKLHNLTTQTRNELNIYLEDWEGNSRHAQYNTFSVADSSSNYSVTISGYSGDVDDDLTLTQENGRHNLNGREFSTKDQDNDGSDDWHCASIFGQGGWWYPTSCGRAILNGQYLTTCSTATPPSCSTADGIVWYSWKTYAYSLKKTTMMIRPVSFPSSSLDTCQNGGTLTPGTPGSGVYTCVCPAGFGGTFCQLACTAGEFGPGCAGTCHCADGDSVCDVMSGVCFSGGCAAGWKGVNCQTVCTAGTFGPGCIGTCHCEDGGSVCNITTGICSTGCAAGWKESDCQTVCESGEFGPGCYGTCHCADGDSVCDVMTGVCSSGECEAGWKENDCQTECSPEEFGLGCNGTCHCADGGSVCNVTNGVCSSGGCAAGWKGYNCQKACNQSSSEFGPGCTGTCHCLTGNSACNTQTGACVGGCAAGWKGNDCQIACSPGEFGPNCANTCHCADGDSACPADTGICSSGGCAAGWEGGRCQTDVDECDTDANNCHMYATCTNTEGSFNCSCNPGYQGNGTSCTEQVGLPLVWIVVGTVAGIVAIGAVGTVVFCCRRMNKNVQQQRDVPLEDICDQPGTGCARNEAFEPENDGDTTLQTYKHF